LAAEGIDVSFNCTMNEAGKEKQMKWHLPLTTLDEKLATAGLFQDKYKEG
jgi:hypothetical protein